MVNSKLLPLLAFLVPLLARMLPEVIMGPYVVGFDTLAYYIPNTLQWLNHGISFWNFIATAPFFFMLLMGIASVGGSLIISLKILSPVLIGLLGLTIYFYGNKTLSWSPKKSMLAVTFATLYFVALRISWDMLRSELALVFLFAALIFLEKEITTRRNDVLLSLAMFFVVFTHQLVAVILLFVVMVTSIDLIVKKRITEMRRLVLSSVPALCLFALIVYANFLGPSTFLEQFPGQTADGFMAIFGFSSYSALIANTLGFLVFCYLPILPIVILGGKRLFGNLKLKAWIIWILIALFFVIINPSAFFMAFPYRWILLLTYPLAFLAADAFSNLKSNKYKAGIFLVLATFSMSFMVLPNRLAFPYYSLFPMYMPTSMLQNTTPLGDCQNTLNALTWVKSNMSKDAHLLVHDAFNGWALLTLNNNQLINYGYSNPATYAQTLVDNGLTGPLYLIWWINGSGWHAQTNIPPVFYEVFESGKIAVFIFNTTSL